MTPAEDIAEARAMFESGATDVPIDIALRLAEALERVRAMPACRDTGHMEALHSAIRCCDPHEQPCAAIEGEGA